MKKQKTSFRSTISRAILVLGVISIFSIWLPNKAAPSFDSCHQEAATLKQYGWDVTSSESNGKCSVSASKSDPKTGRSTQAKYNFNDDLAKDKPLYSVSSETTYKDGHKTSEQREYTQKFVVDARPSVGDVLTGTPDPQTGRLDVKEGPTVQPAKDRLVSKSETTPSGVKTTTTYDTNGQAVKLTKFDPRFNETTQTDVKTKTQTIHSENGKASSTTTTYPGGQYKTQVTKGEDGTVYTYNYDQTGGKILSSQIQKPNGGPTEVYTPNPDGSSTHVTKDPNGNVIATQSCDKFGKCVDAPVNALAKPANLQADKTKKSQPTDQSKVGQTGDKSKMGQDQSKQGLAHNKQQTKADVLKQIGDRSSGDLKNANEKFKTDVLGKIKHNPGQAAGLNPGPSLDKLIGKPKLEDKFTGVKPHFDDKFQTRGNKNLKQDFTKQAVTHGAKINEKVVPRSQSPSQALQGNKHLPQNNLTKNYKAISKPQNWNSSAGSQRAVQHQFQNSNAPADGRLQKRNGQ